MSRFGEESLVEERRRALRALLMHPLLTAGSEELALVKRHEQELRKWLQRNTGWRLVVRAELARLYKVRAETKDATRGLEFSPHRYALLCLALAALERSERQTTLGNLADAIGLLASADPELERAGFTFDLTQRSQRSDLVSVVRCLLDLRLLERVHGDEQQYLSNQGDALYNINRPVLAAMISAQRGPSTLESEDVEERLRWLTEEPWPESGEARHQRIRWQLVRRLVDDPVLYTADLDEEAQGYLTGQKGHMTREIHEAAGLVAEIRAEGIAMVDPEEELTDRALPEEGTDGHLTLLLAEFLARSEGQLVGRAVLEQHVAGLIRRHRRHWSKKVAESGADVRLCREALERLEALSLVRCLPEGVVPLPALARYAMVRLPEENELESTLVEALS